MNPSPVLRGMAAASLAALALATGSAHAVGSPPAFSGLVVFGDSLSDTGRVYAGSGNTFPPSPPHFNGRFSNGPVAAEFLATGLGVNNPVQFINLAVGGAQTGLDGSAGIGTGLRSQVNGFITSLGVANADSGALYMVWGGANDLLQANPLDLLNPVTLNTLVTTSVGNLVGEVQDLYARGARSFLLPLMPDIGKTPFLLNAFGGSFSAQASQIAAGYNTALRAGYGQLAAALPAEHFYIYDTFAATNAAIPLFANSTGQCLADNAFPACTGYMYFDDRHPTTATHAILGAQMLAAVPEPATLLMMGAGVLALLAAGRRRRA